MNRILNTCITDIQELESSIQENDIGLFVSDEYGNILILIKNWCINKFNEMGLEIETLLHIYNFDFVGPINSISIKDKSFIIGIQGDYNTDIHKVSKRLDDYDVLSTTTGYLIVDCISNRIIDFIKFFDELKSKLDIPIIDRWVVHYV